MIPCPPCPLTKRTHLCSKFVQNLFLTQFQYFHFKAIMKPLITAELNTSATHVIAAEQYILHTRSKQQLFSWRTIFKRLISSYTFAPLVYMLTGGVSCGTPGLDLIVLPSVTLLLNLYFPVFFPFGCFTLPPWPLAHELNISETTYSGKNGLVGSKPSCFIKSVIYPLLPIF